MALNFKMVAIFTLLLRGSTVLNFFFRYFNPKGLQHWPESCKTVGGYTCWGKCCVRVTVLARVEARAEWNAYESAQAFYDVCGELIDCGRDRSDITSLTAENAGNLSKRFLIFFFGINRLLGGLLYTFRTASTRRIEWARSRVCALCVARENAQNVRAKMLCVCMCDGFAALLG